jgi:hypothetical protein
MRQGEPRRILWCRALFVRQTQLFIIFIFIYSSSSLAQVLIGTLLIRQPFLIQDIDDYDRAKQSAFGAAGLYFFFFLLSSYFFLKEGGAELQGGNNTNRFGGEYSNVAAYSDDVALENDFLHIPMSSSEQKSGLLL